MNQLKTTAMIQPYCTNPRYWQYKGQPLMLLGGSREDNLFQIPDLAAHLALLRSVGGNYIRCTMSSRDEGDVWPFYFDTTIGKYDLVRFNPVYWQRFADLLNLTASLDIIVQVEVWDRFDFSREPWQLNPFNPALNCNYSTQESGLAEQYPLHPGENVQPFFYSVPACDDNRLLLDHQQAFVDQLLSYSLAYEHILYCMDNETSGAPSWGDYWADYIQQKAHEESKVVCLTEMWDQWDITALMHDTTFCHPERYAFVDVSQNNHLKGDQHWRNLQARYTWLSAQPLPMNMVKIYGADGNKFGHSDDDAVERFWRGLLGGAASLRFHRPPAGLGLNALAQANLRSARLFLAEVDVFSSMPDAAHDLLRDREENSVYACQYAGGKTALYFPRADEALVLIGDEVRVRWLDILESVWQTASVREPQDGVIRLTVPGDGHWLVLLEPIND